ncbi:MAG: type II toxin-antitoxin system death-on-curing family toxin [Azospirillum sp.]|nr:type II toxin-antitoxin system death-on-curing family toxin [Azospirillum sp.]
MDIRFLEKIEIEILHGMTLKQHGGGRGLRDVSLFESALARPLNLAAYRPDASLAELGASLCYGLANNHPFVDGNKRTALLALTTFFAFNDVPLELTQEEAVEMMLAVASGRMDEPALAAFLGERLAPVKATRMLANIDRGAENAPVGSVSRWLEARERDQPGPVASRPGI